MDSFLIFSPPRNKYIINHLYNQLKTILFIVPLHCTLMLNLHFNFIENYRFCYKKHIFFRFK